jgi:hypothetical protein
VLASLRRLQGSCFETHAHPLGVQQESGSANRRVHKSNGRNFLNAKQH